MSNVQWKNAVAVANEQSRPTNDRVYVFEQWGIVTAPFFGINIRFIAAAPLQPQIKNVKKIPVMTQYKTPAPSLFQVSSNLGTAVHAGSSASSPNPAPFADLPLQPAKMQPAFETKKSDPGKTGKSSFQPATSKKGGNRGAGKPSRVFVDQNGISSSSYPQAKSVKLAADFYKLG